MAVGSTSCSRCDALLILQAAGTPGLVTTYAAGANDFQPLQLPSLAEDMAELDARGGAVVGDLEDLNALADEDPAIPVECSCRRPYHLDRCQKRAPYGFIPNGDSLPLACKAFGDVEAEAVAS